MIPKLILPNGDQLLTEAEYLIGRHKNCDICFFDDPKMSRRHATVFKENGVYWIKDGTIGKFIGGIIDKGTRSGNGTFINGVKLNQDNDWKAILTHGDELMLGQTYLRYWFPIFVLDTDEGQQTYSEKFN